MAKSGVRIKHVPLLGGWFVVRGPHDTPLSGSFPSKKAAKQSLVDAEARRNALSHTERLKAFAARMEEPGALGEHIDGLLEEMRWEGRRK